MTEADDVLQGFFIGAITIISLVSIGCFIRQRIKYKNIFKQSPTIEDLTSIYTEDPQQPKL